MARYHVNGELLASLREKHGLRPDDVSTYLGVKEDTVKAFEASDSPKVGLTSLKKLAQLYGVSVFDFRKSVDQISVPSLPDFRKPNRPAAKVGIKAWRRIKHAESLQNDLEELAEDSPELLLPIQFSTFSAKSPTDKVARYIRSALSLTWEYQADTNRDETLYDFLRYSIEARGVNVIHESYPVSDSRGFCLIGKKSGADIICVNTNKAKTKKARVFTLIHELCHVLLREQGLSDHTITKNSVERFCNRVAENTLLPAEKFESFVGPYIKNETLEFDRLRRLSEQLGVSQYAFAVRLSRLRIVERDYVQKWRANLPASLFEDLEDGNLDPGQDGEDDDDDSSKYLNPSLGTRRINRIGLGISGTALRAYDSDIRDDIDLYREFGIKPDDLSSLRTAVAKKAKLAGAN
jgi:Zn-dependent peptidase ImmA (M78 family)